MLCKYKFLRTILSVLALLLVPGMLLAEFELDPTFGTGGITTTNVADANDFFGAMVILSNGKTLLPGRLSNGSNFDFAVVQFEADGDVDLTFGNGGVATANFPGNGNDFAKNLAVQSDGKIIVAGFITFDGVNFDDVGIVRFDSDGNLDPTFGTGGFAVLSFPGNGDDFPSSSISILSDDSIIVTGSTSSATDSDFFVAKYDANGNLDSSFGTGGIVTTAFPGGNNDFVNSAEIQSDGKIVMAGTTDNGPENDFALARYNTDDTPDTSFGNGGIVITDFPLNADDALNQTALQSDGKIIAVGGSLSGPTGAVALVRYNPDGTLDFTFGNGGFVTTDFPGFTNSAAWDVAIRNNGKIVVACSIDDGLTGNFALVEYNPDGSFCDSSKTITNVSPNIDDSPWAIGIQTDGKIVMSGVSDISNNLDMVIARYEATNLGINPQILPTALEGAAYNQVLTVTGGTAPFTFTLDSGTLPDGILFDEATGTFSGTPSVGSTGTYELTVSVEDDNGLKESQCYQFVVALFTAGFDDGVLNPGWTFTGAWEEIDGFLVGGISATRAKKKALAVADPFSGCTDCTFRALMSTAGGSGNRVSLLGWFEDTKTNVELIFKEEKDVVVLKQKAKNGTGAKGKAKFEIIPDQVYDVEIEFDGTDFNVRINGADVLTVPAGSTPFGTAAFQVKNTTGKFGDVEVFKRTIDPN